MHRISRFRPSPAMIVAIVALVLSLGGTSYAAIVLPAGSVGTKQLKADAVIGSKVKNGSLTTADISSASLSKTSRIAIARGNATVSGSSARIAQVSIMVPKTGFVLVQGWVTANTANGEYYVRVWDDTASVSSDYWYDGVTGTGSYTSVGNMGVFPVTAGEHLFSVRIEYSSAGTYDAFGTITAQFIPYGATGSPTVLGDSSVKGAAQRLH